MRTAVDVFVRFLMLGFTSFGGPAAHIGYFRRSFVEELGWIDDRHFASLTALAQFLPGPASSQLGFAIGLHRGGLASGIAAFVGFTLPSVVLMLALAISGNVLLDHQWVEGVIHGLKLLAVVVVADACLGMYGNFCTDTKRGALAIVSAAILLLAGSLATQMLVLLAAAGLGMMLLRNDEAESDTSPVRPAWLPFLLFVALMALSLMPGLDGLLGLAGDFFFAGSVVFGGGHVVLPILQELVADNMAQDQFLTGYAAAQAVPGPMFTLATYLGAGLAESPIVGALVATAAIFLPGFLLILAFADSWQQLMRQPVIGGAAAGINAAVVGLLIAVLYDPIVLTTVQTSVDVVLILLAFFALRVLKVNVAALVLTLAVAGVLTVVW